MEGFRCDRCGTFGSSTPGHPTQAVRASNRLPEGWAEVTGLSASPTPSHLCNTCVEEIKADFQELPEPGSRPVVKPTVEDAVVVVPEG